jgi:hypothetical protein
MMHRTGDLMRSRAAAAATDTASAARSPELREAVHKQHEGLVTPPARRHRVQPEAGKTAAAADEHL